MDMCVCVLTLAGTCFMVLSCNCILGECKVQVLSLRGQSELSSTPQVVPTPSVVIRWTGKKEDASVEDFSHRSAGDSAVR